MNFSLLRLKGHRHHGAGKLDIQQRRHFTPSAFLPFHHTQAISPATIETDITPRQTRAHSPAPMLPSMSQGTGRPLLGRHPTSWGYPAEESHENITPLSLEELETGSYATLPPLRHVGAFRAQACVVEAPALQRGFSHRAEIVTITGPRKPDVELHHGGDAGFIPHVDFPVFRLELNGVELEDSTPGSPTLVRRPATRRRSRSVFLEEEGSRMVEPSTDYSDASEKHRRSTVP